MLQADFKRKSHKKCTGMKNTAQINLVSLINTQFFFGIFISNEDDDLMDKKFV